MLRIKTREAKLLRQARSEVQLRNENENDWFLDRPFVESNKHLTKMGPKMILKRILIAGAAAREVPATTLVRARTILKYMVILGAVGAMLLAGGCAKTTPEKAESDQPRSEATQARQGQPNFIKMMQKMQEQD
ncbi:MAG: hypothetical protein ACREOO_16420 [bacterium]